YTLMGWLMAGFSRLTLYFGVQGRPEASVLEIHDKQVAYRCEACGTVVIERARAWVCPQCRSMVPANEAHCPNCGPAEPTRRCPICQTDVPAALPSCPYCAGAQTALATDERKGAGPPG